MAASEVSAAGCMAVRLNCFWCCWSANAKHIICRFLRNSPRSLQCGPGASLCTRAYSSGCQAVVSSEACCTYSGDRLFSLHTALETDHGSATTVPVIVSEEAK